MGDEGGGRGHQACRGRERAGQRGSVQCLGSGKVEGPGHNDLQSHRVHLGICFE